MKDSLDEDPVVYEADVKFAAKRRGDLFLFQFAHNASPFSAKKHSLGAIKAKPKSNQFEIELRMNTQSDTFDHEKGKRIAFNVDDDARDEDKAEKYFPNHLMNSQQLNSEKLTSTGLQFALAYLRNDLNEVQLIPIKNLLEFKPAFRYLDKVKVRTSNKNQEESDEDDEQEFVSSTKPEQATNKVTMRFEDKNEKRKIPEKETNQEEPEQWLNVEYFDYGQSKFDQEKNAVLYKMNQEIIEENRYVLIDQNLILEIIQNFLISTSAINNEVNKFSYEEFATNPIDLTNEKNSPAFKEDGQLKVDLLNTLPFYQTCSLPLNDQIRSILCSSKVISFDKCIQLLKLNLEKNRLAQQSNESNLDHDLVLRYLQQFAQLVQGSWVVKSEIIYPKSFRGTNGSFDVNSIPFTKISVDMLCKARDYVLYQFTKQASLSRLELIEQIRVPPDVISEILAQFSNFNQDTRSWDFIYPLDEKFLSEHEEIAHRQQIQWKAEGNQLLNMFG